MIENLFELSLSVIDYSIMLYFYAKICGFMLAWKKSMLWILTFSLLQFIKDMCILDMTTGSLMDSVIVITCLFTYSPQKTKMNFFFALLIDVLQIFSVIFGVSILTTFTSHIQDTYIFGMQRILFAMTLKLFYILVLYILIKPLQEFKMNYSEKPTFLFTSAILIFSISFSYSYGLILEDHRLVTYIILLMILLLLMYQLLIRYSIALKKNAEHEITSHMMEETLAKVKTLYEEQEEIRMIRHDMKNTLLILTEFMENKQYEEMEAYLDKIAPYNEYTGELVHTENHYVNALINQKMGQYSDITFHLDLFIKDAFELEPRDIVSLFSNIIDNACEELIRIQQTDLYLSLTWDSTQLHITQRNACEKNKSLDSHKPGKNHGYGLMIIHDIVHAYGGNIHIEHDETFELKALLFPKS